MTNELQVFNDSKFGKVRTLRKGEDILFVAKDVCDVLGHSNHRKALQGLDDDEKGVTKGYTLGGNQELSIVTESGLYTLIIRSNKPKAKEFRKWITGEVLPSIRKTGKYDPNLNNKPHSVLGFLEVSLIALKQHDDRISNVERFVEEKKSEKQQAEEEMYQLSPPTVAATPITTRQSINKLIRSHFVKTGVVPQQSYNNLYAEFCFRDGIDLKKRAKNSGESPLDIAEELGVIEKLYALAVETLGHLEVPNHA